jgi:AbiV family abortive infection protein
MDEILVPKDKLSDGFEKSKNHVEFLLESSKILYDKKKYSLSIPILVLALEECYKMRFILDHITKDVGITKSEWDDITKGRDVHKSKLKKVYSEPKKEIEEHGEENYKIISSFMAKMGDKTIWKSYPESIEISQYVEERLAKLDVIKQDCFYLGWKKADWYNFIQISLKQREALAYHLLYVVKVMFNLYSI